MWIDRSGSGVGKFLSEVGGRFGRFVVVTMLGESGKAQAQPAAVVPSDSFESDRHVPYECAKLAGCRSDSKNIHVQYCTVMYCTVYTVYTVYAVL